MDRVHRGHLGDWNTAGAPPSLYTVRQVNDSPLVPKLLFTRSRTRNPNTRETRNFFRTFILVLPQIQPILGVGGEKWRGIEIEIEIERKYLILKERRVEIQESRIISVILFFSSLYLESNASRRTQQGKFLSKKE